MPHNRTLSPVPSWLLQPVGAPEFTVGWAQSQGNRPYQDDRCVEFTLPLPTGGAALVWAVSCGEELWRGVMAAVAGGYQGPSKLALSSLRGHSCLCMGSTRLGLPACLLGYQLQRPARAVPQHAPCLHLCHSVLQVADGHHQHHVSELVCDELQETLRAAVAEQPDVEAALVSAECAVCCGLPWLCEQ